MAYFLLLVVTLTLFLRPGDLVADLAEVPIYLWSILGALAAAIPQLTNQFRSEMIVRRPITACVLGIWGAVVLSVMEFSLWDVRMSAWEFAKIITYYFLLVGIVTSERQLNHFLKFLAVCILVLAVLPILHEQGIIELESIKALQQIETNSETGEKFFLPRMQSTGIFNDPNDLATIVVVGIILCWHFVWRDSSWGGSRPVWLAGIGILAYVLYQTHSRGGLVSLIAALVAFLTAQFGWRKASPVLCIGIPLIFILFSSRATNMSVEGGTGQERIQLWSEGLTMLRTAPVVGVGFNRFADHAGILAHNAFVNSYAELGFPGGTCFFGAFACACAMLAGSKTLRLDVTAPEIDRFRPCLMGLTVGYAAGMLSLSRAYVVPTYLVLGLTTVWFSLAGGEALMPQFCVSVPHIKRLVFLSAAFVLAIYIYVRTFAKWS